LAKPAAAKPAVAKSVDSVTEAERYIYGRGVAQDCDRGLRLLKPAAEQSNVKAMISLGALYSTGTCTPRDLPTAYRWFALALHKEPDNQVLQTDLQNLWSKMTPPERQLAIKLSQ
jgi:TPR repeat protein